MSIDDILAEITPQPRIRASWWQCRWCLHVDESPNRTAQAERDECLAHESDCKDRPCLT